MCEIHLCQAPFEITNLPFVSGKISVRVTIIYRLHQTKNNGLNAADVFKEYSECVANLVQHMQERTHIHRHISDIVISRGDDNLIRGVSVSSMLSDHFLINSDVSLHKRSVSAKVISCKQN